jgi:hypothetical protein
LGTSLFGATLLMPPHSSGNTTVIGLPAPGVELGFPTPGVYLGYVQSQLAVEGQVGLIVVSYPYSHSTSHLLSAGGQFDYLFNRSRLSSPYVFGGAGFLEEDGFVGTFSAGAGYRMVVGDRLVFRFDGRYTHFSSAFGHAVGFVISIGGLFPSR